MTITPQWGDVIRDAIHRNQMELWTAMPGMVQAVESDGQFVDIVPLLRLADYDEDGKLEETDAVVIPAVPVCHPQGGGFFVSVPIAVGDIMLIVFCMRSVDQFLAQAKKGELRYISVGDQRMHQTNGALALPLGPAPGPSLLQDVSSTDMVIGRDSSAGGSIAQLRLKADGSIELDAPSGMTVNGDLDVTGEITAKSAGAQSVTVTGHEHFTAMGPTPKPTPGT